jgi:hypothetical protein
MSTPLERAWSDVIAGVSARPGSIAALVNALDRCEALDRIKQRVLAEAAAELRADREPPADTRGTAARWLHHHLADGERRVHELRADAAHAGYGWRTIERAKRDAGVTAARHGGASWWSLTNSATPPALTPRGGNL